jgi:hypothetical protein
MKHCAWLLVALCSILLGGCVKQMRGTPDTDAMLVIQCNDISWTKDVSFKHDERYSITPMYCWCVPLTENEGFTEEIKVERLTHKGIFVFSDLKPGSYRVTKVAAQQDTSQPGTTAVPTDYKTFYYRFPASEFPELTVKLLPGQIEFLGTIKLAIKHGDSLNSVRVSRNAEDTTVSLSTFDEYFVLKDVLKEASDGPWAPALNEKINNYHQ